MSSHSKTGIHPARRRAQSGVALIVVLILLVVMTLLALISLRGTLMQERMSAGQYDRSLGFQSAEGALREAESVASGRPVAPANGCDANAVCATPVPTDTPRWLLSTAGWNAISKQVTNVDPGALTAKPRYIVEYLGQFPGKTCTTSGDVSETTCADLENLYRITARSRAANRADVTLQTIYAVP